MDTINPIPSMSNATISPHLLSHREIDPRSWRRLVKREFRLALVVSAVREGRIVTPLVLCNLQFSRTKNARLRDCVLKSQTLSAIKLTYSPSNSERHALENIDELNCTGKRDHGNRLRRRQTFDRL